MSSKKVESSERVPREQTTTVSTAVTPEVSISSLNATPLASQPAPSVIKNGFSQPPPESKQHSMTPILESKQVVAFRPVALERHFTPLALNANQSPPIAVQRFTSQ